MISPYRRAVGLRAATLARRALALVFIALLLTAQFQSALADDKEATVHIRGDERAAPPADHAEEPTESQDPGFLKVGEREVAASQAQSVSVGDNIVSYALQYVGYPYVWAGNTPAGFDCSGFTEWVILNTLGIDIGHGIDGQPGSGAWVDWGAWQPGDIVFFQNTYRAGLSHVGIYIGDGLFVHAENEGTGVRISSMYSDYYGSRYWGSNRVR